MRLKLVLTKLLLAHQSSVETYLLNFVRHRVLGRFDNVYEIKSLITLPCTSVSR